MSYERCVASVIFVTLLSIYFLPENTNAQCAGLWVSNAVAQPTMNGYYYLIGNAYCNGVRWWMQQTENGGPNNYIFWVDGQLFNSTYSYTNSWVIAPWTCTAAVYVYAKNTLTYNTAYPPYPYSMPGYWQEYDSTSMSYVINDDLTVTCSSSLSLGAIFGIVIGCLVGSVLIIAILVCICAKYNTKKRRTAATPHPPPAVVYTTGNVYNCPPSYPSSAGGQQPQAPTITVIEPPKYDNDPPPSYDNVNFTV